ncbi:unnamed protein product [Caenorhabditis angaria]|uniref:Phospholipid/glycerol acyltransferase domain-containing protein n=1 Tax=Caenorhabditis angaria TaxID=860376 RepID=A0A9P1J1C4_9PELO|nr:unnamed protein product [Caenorhabditis angaria]
MFLGILYLYLSIVIGAFLATVTLIFCGLNWGRLPHLYLQLVSRIQACFPDPIEYVEPRKYQEHHSSDENDSQDVMEFPVKTIESGLDSIVNGDFGSCFSTAPSRHETLLRLKPLAHWSPFQTAIFYLCLLFRVSFLLPVRIALLVSSFVFVAIAGFYASVKKLTNIEKTWVAIVYCRLFCSGMGLIASYKNMENRPRKPGVAVANHLTPNDIQILFAGTPHGSSYGYVVTGQKHVGIIGLIEHLVEKLCPSLWLERKNSNERQNFLADVLRIAKEEGPVLLFPEGYCSNNTQVLQFRKAAFEDGINIYPVAIKQNPEYGDGFWFEDEFHTYLLRSMTGWALVYDIQYLEMQTRNIGEDNVDFAKRIQCMIAKAADIPVSKYGGNVWYRQQERQKLKEAQQEENAQTLTQLDDEQQRNNFEQNWTCTTKPIIEHIDSVIDSQYEQLITVYS